ncbi:hypothetical protein [Roseivivax sp. CAU 1753]
MGLKKYAGKLDDYYARLTQGKAEKIEASHVEKVIAKLETKKQQLEAEIEATTKESKRLRLARKKLIADEQIRRAHLLLGQIGGGGPTQPEADAPAPEGGTENSG